MNVKKISLLFTYERKLFIGVFQKIQNCKKYKLYFNKHNQFENDTRVLFLLLKITFNNYNNNFNNNTFNELLKTVGSKIYHRVVAPWAIVSMAAPTRPPSLEYLPIK